ncbi:MAG: peptide chain release factor I [Planctomycetes bacterium RBG_16_64_10]|nr:MAG: peptide chain release factor I [Planctomycetes bacterium RBG_16_64_10]
MKSVPTLRVNSRIAIPRSELRFSFVRSSGPGGQNVNKVSSKAVLRWSVVKSRSIPDDVRGRFLSRHFRRVNDRGELVLTSQRYRDRARNVDDCLEKLRALVLAVASVPRPRKKTQPSGAVREKRLRQKRATAEKKERRRPPHRDD